MQERRRRAEAQLRARRPILMGSYREHLPAPERDCDGQAAPAC